MLKSMLPLILSMSGPTHALLRYIATAIGGALAARGYVDAAGAQAVAGGLIALIPAIIGVLTSTVTAKIATAQALPEVKAIGLTNGNTVTNPYQVNSAMNDR